MTGTHRIMRVSTVHEGWTKLIVATIRLPDGRTITREIEDHGSAICVLPCHPQRRTAVLVRQLRAPVLYASGQHETLEAIAGIVEEDDPAQCARREAEEEAGLALDTLDRLFTGWTMPGLSTERMHFFLATYSGEARRARGGAAGEHEDVLAVEIALTELARMVDAGQLTDVKTMLLIQSARLRLPALFAG
ncbi:MAG: NUDIX hydrolase [Pseudorhodoplanes sp.]|nr:NUDIX hydrolase [Pseudorhodoplanes sp.]